jgi:hypothetical protein
MAGVLFKALQKERCFLRCMSVSLDLFGLIGPSFRVKQILEMPQSGTGKETGNAE